MSYFLQSHVLRNNIALQFVETIKDLAGVKHSLLSWNYLNIKLKRFLKINLFIVLKIKSLSNRKFKSVVDDFTSNCKHSYDKSPFSKNLSNIIAE